MGRLLALIGVLIVATLIAWAGERLPKPEPANAPATEFSAERAMTDVQAMAAVPHPLGTPENARVRDHLLRRMTELGLAPQVRPGTGVLQPDRAPNLTIAGRIENVVGVLPGRDRTAPAVALMAHYDSVPGSPGAADDIAGVAAALEIARAIKAKGTPARDVMLILTDGEEAGLLGANAFFQRDPLAKRVGFVINMEARGSSGRVQMFQTGRGNGETVDLFRRSVPRATASSLAVYIYERMPNDTDFTEVRRVGLGGLNFAFVDRQFDYHSPTSTPATLDRGSLQELGAQVLGVTWAAAQAAALPKSSPDLAYSQLFGGFVLSHPPAAGWAILALAALLIGLGLWRARKIEAFPWLDLARGAGAALFAVVGAAAVLHFVRRATGVEMGFMEQRYLLAQADRWEVAVMLLGVGFLAWAACELARGRRNLALVPLAAGIASSAFGGFDKVGLILGLVAAVIGALAYGRPVSRPGGWGGVLLLGLVLCLAAQAVAPTAAVVLLWPLALASVGAAGTALAARRGYASLALLALLAALGLGWLGGYAHGAFVSLDLPEILAVFALLGAFLIWPLAQPEEGAPPARLIGPLLAAAGFIVFLLVRIQDPWSPRFPQATHLTYHADLDRGRAYVVSSAAGDAQWTADTLAAYGPVAKRRHWLWDRPVDTSPAPFVEQAPPAFATTRRDDGRLAVQVAPPPGGLGVRLQIKPSVAVTLESVGGVPASRPLKVGGWSTIWHSGSAEGTELVFKPSAPGRMDVRVISSLPGWPAGVKPLPKRPADVMRWDTSDGTTVTITHGVAW